MIETIAVVDVRALLPNGHAHAIHQRIKSRMTVDMVMLLGTDCKKLGLRRDGV